MCYIVVCELLANRVAQIKGILTRHIKEVFNTDAIQYGGSNKLNESISIVPEGFTAQLAPLATMIFEVKF
jgi:hypothetical protein